MHPIDNEKSMRIELTRRKKIRDPFRPLGQATGRTASGPELRHDWRYTWEGVGGGKQVDQ